MGTKQNSRSTKARRRLLLRLAQLHDERSHAQVYRCPICDHLHQRPMEVQ